MPADDVRKARRSRNLACSYGVGRSTIFATVTTKVSPTMRPA